MKLQHHCFATAILCILLFSACKHDPRVYPDPDPIPNPNPIRFDNLTVGQSSRYIGLWGEDYYTNNNNHFGYTDDTLQLKIVGLDTQGFKVEETFHYTGDVLSWWNYDKDSVYHYYLKIKADTLRFNPSHGTYINSRIFGYFTVINGLPLADITSPKIEISGWKTNLPYCECRRTGYAEDYSLFGQTYPRLNVVVDNSPISFDGNGETHVFSKAKGIVRYSTYSWWTQAGIGWDLLPQ
ncbi:MAG: hypothetical protein ACKVU0_11945 [Saprospiraceae bacterium]